MAISWGSYGSVGAPGGYKFRTGLSVSYSPTTITASTTSVTVTTKLYLGGEAYGNGTNGRYELTGDESQTSEGWNWNISSNGGYDLIATFTETVNLSYSGSKTFSVTAKIRPSYTWGGYTPSKTVKITIPRRPYSKPAAPSGASITSTSDTRIDIKWTRNTSGAAPYEKQHVSRQVDSNSFTAISTNVSGTATTFSDTNVGANRRYRYAVRAWNSGGTSGWAYTPYTYTSPNRPGTPSVAKNTSGGIIVAIPTLPSPWVDRWRVIHVKNGVRQSSPLQDLPTSTGSYVMDSPDPAATHAFRVQVRTPNGLWSDDGGTSKTIQLITPPLAPTKLAPSGAVDITQPIPLTWQHNPLDESPQKYFQINRRFSDDGGATWGAWSASGKTASVTEGYDIPTSWGWHGLTEWQVRTWGEHADPSPYSDSQIIDVTTRPTVTVVLPDEWSTSRITAGLSYYDAEGTEMSRWAAELVHAGSVVDRASGYGSVEEFSFAYRVADGESYTVRARAMDGAGLWSEWDEVTVPVAYPRPAAPIIAAEWSREGGTVTLEVTGQTPVDPEVAAVGFAVYRQTPDGGWLLVADGLPADTTVVDNIAPTNADVTYVAVSESSLGSTTVGQPVTVNTRSPYVFLNYGDGFTRQARLWATAQATRRHQRDKTLQYFEGRDGGLPVEFVGEDREISYDLSAALFGPWVPERMPSSLWEDVEGLSDAAGPVCLRDPEGVRLFVSVSGADLGNHLKGKREVKVPLTVVGYDEGPEVTL